MATQTNRPMLMDKQWEMIQKKTFTKWVNSHLAKRGSSLIEISEDFKDGLKLIQFFEIISNKEIGAKFEKKPKLRIQMIQNVSTALKFLAEQKVKLVSISAEDIVDSNLKLILGMIWTIILRFQIEDISVEELSSRDALLLWCKRKTEGYRDCKVDNFHTSWQDGMAFCAIIHKHRPDLINYDSLDKTNKKENLKLAFDVAEKEFGIPQLLDLEDIVDIAKPDERSIITYVSQYYHYFSAGRKQEVAGRRIGRLVDLATSTEQLKSDYNERAKKLTEWIKKKIVELKDLNFSNESLEKIKELLQKFIEYKENEKPEKAAEKLALEALFNNIALKLRSNNRSPFVPDEGLSSSDIQKLWDQLLAAERDRDDALRKDQEKQERLDHLNRRLNQKADKLEAWIAVKEKYLAKDELVDSLNSAKERLNNHGTFYDEYNTNKPRLNEVQEIAKEIAALGASNTQEIQQRVNTITEKFGNLKPSADTKKQTLQKKLEIQEKMEQLRIDFAKLVKEYNRWIGSLVDKINDHTFGDSLEDVQSYKIEMEKEDMEASSSSKEKVTKLHSVWDEMQTLGITDLKYTVLTIKDVDSRHTQLEESLKRRQNAHEEELKRQLAMEEKRKEFAVLAQSFIDHITSRKESLRKLEGEPDILMEAVKKGHNEGIPEKEKLNDVFALSKQMNDMGINENKHTELTSSILSNRAEQLSSWVRNYIQGLNEEKELKVLYVTRAQEFKDWIQQNIPHLKERGFDNTLSGAQTKNSEFQQYKTGPKAEASTKKPELERLFASITSLLKKNSRPEFKPNQGLTLNDLDNEWKVLEEEERKKEEDLLKELRRQERLEALVRKFNGEASELETWENEKVKYLSIREEIPSLYKAQFTIKLFEAFHTEFQNRQPRIQQLEDIKNKIASDNYVDLSTINIRYESILRSFQNLETQTNEKNTYLHSQLDEQQKNEDLRFEFARLSKEMNDWVKNSIEEIEDYNFGFTLDAVTSYKQQLDKSDHEYNSKSDEKHNSLLVVIEEMNNRKMMEQSKHSNIKVESIPSIRKNLSDSLERRQKAYSEELKKQGAAEELRKQFAEKGKLLLDHLASAKIALDNFVGSIPDKINHIKITHNEGNKGKEHIDELTILNDKMRMESVYGNSHTKHTLPSLISKKNQHDRQVESSLAALTEEGELQDRISTQEAELKQQERKENLVVQFSGKAKAINFWLENADEALNDAINVSSVEDTEKLISEYDKWEGEVPQKEKDRLELHSLAEEMKNLKVNDFSGVSIEELDEKWNSFRKISSERKHSLDKELITQKTNDAARRNFADKAKNFSGWVHSQKQQLSSSKGDLEEQLQSIKPIRTSYVTKKKDLEELESINKQLEASGIKRNPYTDLTLRTLNSEYEQLGTAMSKQETLLNNEILSKKNADVSPEQLNEFNEVFNHFDKNRDGTLARLEIKACLQALGDEPTESELDGILNTWDPERKGINFQAFTNMMISRHKDTDSKDEMLIAFKDIANDKDFVLEEDLRKVMTSERVNYLLQKMPKYSTGNGYDYKAWVEQAYK